MTRTECPHCRHLFEPQRDQSGRLIGGTVGGFGGAAVGAAVGESIGIALLGTAIVGTLPLAIVGGIALAALGHRIGKEFDNVRCPNCATEFKLTE